MAVKDNNDIADQPCRRCKNNPSVLVVRTEPLCRECFVRYVNTKIIKRMESFRVRHAAPGQQRKILLPLSFGVSSLVLLHVLDFQLKTQSEKSGRTGFSLCVVYIDASTVDSSAPDAAMLQHVQERYPHDYATVPLQTLFELLPLDDPLLISLCAPDLPSTATSSDRISSLLSSLTSSTARADVLPMLRTRLLVEEAKQRGCEGILWGDSTTKLAEKTLSETAKGRGYSLPWHIADGESPLGIPFHYPNRDVLKKELVAYIDLADPPLSSLVHGPSAASTTTSMSSKTTTIDELMKNYFESVEENFPSIVANVVRTAGKLQVKETRRTAAQCNLCNMPVTDGRFGIHGWGGDQEDGLQSAGPSSGLCYGCSRTIPNGLR
ncbi:hypothetical protein M011DRAFT_496845 [Sporormia fimetaria CBS 119925]|uniref:Cytoplasmic tRNA 2-thiolation protein 2 n=1 Tax=Sporormia fimetaria CBS 119925 TaxID=1340428 RepID=A0A6A6V1N0_9PLEO|nr:hypothetical protein M011DRAFT_496845 [Sporormia fimetaria CBS 119925]